VARLLAPVSAVWSWRAGSRMDQKPEMVAPVPVVCVGNLVVGGAGKTPTALAVARLAKAGGFRVGFLTRGYGGREKGPLLVDPARHRAEDVGDEPLLLAAEAPTVVGGDRPRGAERLIAEGVDLIVMDDGFQNPSLAKDLALVVVDAASGIGNGRVMPAGPLRAPLEVQLRHADALVATGDGSAAERVIQRAEASGKVAHRARLVAKAGGDWTKGRVLAFAGIARPEKFFASLREAGARIAATETFPDHHRFTDAEARRLIDRAAREELRLVTTDKDHARMRGAEGAVGELYALSETLPVELAFERPEEIAALIQGAADRVRRRGTFSSP
jgi:tetraacyldisaccharide 4'-kinase